MIDTVLKYLRDKLNVYLGNTPPGLIQFPSELPGDSINLPSDCVALLLVRIEEEKTMRFDERYIRTKGTAQNLVYTSAKPAIPLHLYLLFISRFKDYNTGLKHLSSVILFFQSQLVLQPDNLPELVAELHTPTFTVQNEIWGALKAPQHPAVMYKITMLMLESEETTGDAIQEVHTTSGLITN